MDTAGAKHFSLYGYSRRTTPELERIAARARVYTRCFAPGSWTTPSHASLFTGLYPSDHQVDDHLNFSGRILSSDYQHLVPILSQAGYRTYGISCNGLVCPIYGNCRGFDAFYDYSGIHGIVPMLKARTDSIAPALIKNRNQTQKILTRINMVIQNAIFHKDVKRLFNSARTFLSEFFRIGALHYSAPYTLLTFYTAKQVIKEHQRTYPDTPFFLFINVIENHAYYNPPKKYRRFSRRSDRQEFHTRRLLSEDLAHLRASVAPICRNLYDDTIFFLDNLIGKFWDFLQTLGLLDRTLFISTSDHGEHFGEKGFFGHGYSLFNELIWVPLLIHYPGALNFGGVDERLVSLTDLFSTILDVTGSPFPQPYRSHSLLSKEKCSSVSSMNINIEASKTHLAQMVTWSDSLKFHRYALMTDNNFKILEKENGRIAIYNLAADRDEEHDLFSFLEPMVRRDLLSLLAADQQ
jgi:arylsulfatase A-like enzyme